MTKSKRGKSDISSPGEVESSSDVIEAEIVNDASEVVEKKKRYAKSRKGIGGRKSQEHIFKNPVVLNFITYLISRHASDRNIAQQINVPLTSFHRWKHKNIELWNVPEINSLQQIKEVEVSLYQRAKGYWIERPIYDKQGNFLRTKYQYYPPSDSAAQYFLNNRAPQDWKSKVEHNHAIEELPLAVNFVRKSAKELPAPIKPKAIVDDFGNEVIVDGNETTT